MDDLLGKIDKSIDANAVILDRVIETTMGLIHKQLPPSFYSEDKTAVDVNGFLPMVAEVYKAVRHDVGLSDWTDMQLEAVVIEYVKEKRDARKLALEGEEAKSEPGVGVPKVPVAEV